MASLTPKSGKTMPDRGNYCPDGVKRSSFPDKESPNSCEAFDGSKAVFPLKEQDYLQDACGKD